MTEDNTNTDFSKKCSILANFWMEYRDEESLGDFFEYNDLGLPLAYAVDLDLAKLTTVGEAYVTECWQLLCQALEIPDDVKYESLADLLVAAGVDWA